MNIAKFVVCLMFLRVHQAWSECQVASHFLSFASLLLKRFVISSLDESSKIIVDIESFDHTHSTSGGVRNVSDFDQLVDLASNTLITSGLIHAYWMSLLGLGFWWLETVFLSKVLFFKLGAPSDAVAADCCSHLWLGLPRSRKRSPRFFFLCIYYLF